jgi:hypothetical protein
MSRMVAVALVLVGGLEGANAQQPKFLPGEDVPPEVRERLELQRVKRRIWTDQQIEQMIFQPDGTAAGARRRFDGLLAKQISALDQAYTFTDAQKEKLRLAGRGDIKRFFDKCETVKRKFQLVNQGEQNLQEINQDLRLLQNASHGLFNENSLLRKALHNTLAVEQVGRQEAMVRERRAFSPVRVLDGHHGEGWRAWVTRLAVSPDGRRVVTVGGDAIRLWDLATGKAIRVFGQDQSGYWSVAFSPDGRWIATGSNDHSARLWDAATGQEVLKFTGHEEAVWGVAFVADGRQLVTGAWDQSLRVWDVATGNQLRSFEGVRDNIRCLACSPDGKLIAAGHFAAQQQPGILQLWDLEQGKEIRTFRGHTQEISSVAFSPDGRMLLTSSYDNTVRLWDVATGREIKRLQGHTHRVEGAAFSPDGRTIVSCGNQFDGTLRIWDAARGQQLLCSEPCEGGFLDVAFSPQLGYVVTAGKDSMARLWPWKQLRSQAK